MTRYAWCVNNGNVHYCPTITACMKQAREQGLEEIFIAPVEDEYVPNLFENVDVLLEYVLKRDNNIPRDDIIELDITNEEYSLLRGYLNDAFRRWMYSCNIEFNKEITGWKLYKVSDIHVVK